MKKQILILVFFLLLIPFANANPKPNFFKDVIVKLVLGGKTYNIQSYILNSSTMDKQSVVESYNLGKNYNNTYITLTNVVVVTINPKNLTQELLDWISAGKNVQNGQLLISHNDKIDKNHKPGRIKAFNLQRRFE